MFMGKRSVVTLLLMLLTLGVAIVSCGDEPEDATEGSAETGIQKRKLETASVYPTAQATAIPTTVVVPTPIATATSASQSKIWSIL